LEDGNICITKLSSFLNSWCTDILMPMLRTVSSNDVSREIVTASHIQRQVQSVVPQIHNYLIKTN